MFEKAFEFYEGNLLAYIKAVYFLKDKTKVNIYDTIKLIEDNKVGL